mgnify:CR=1 FL=1
MNEWHTLHIASRNDNHGETWISLRDLTEAADAIRIAVDDDKRFDLFVKLIGEIVTTTKLPTH